MSTAKVIAKSDSLKFRILPRDYRSEKEMSFFLGSTNGVPIDCAYFDLYSTATVSILHDAHGISDDTVKIKVSNRNYTDRVPKLLRVVESLNAHDREISIRLYRLLGRACRDGIGWSYIKNAWE